MSSASQDCVNNPASRGIELESLMWNGVLDLGYGSHKPERTVLLQSGEGAC